MTRLSLIADELSRAIALHLRGLTTRAAVKALYREWWEEWQSTRGV